MANCTPNVPAETRLVNWKDLYYLVADKVATDDPQLPQEVIWSYIQRGVTDLAKKSSAMRVSYVLDLQCGVEEYPVELTDAYRVVDVLEVIKEDCPLPPVSTRMAHRYGDGGYFLEEGWINICPVPSCDVSRGLELRLAIAPTRKSCGVDEDWAEEHAEGIAAYVMAQVHGTRGMLYDPTLMRKYDRDYRYAISEAANSAESGNTNYHYKDRRVDMFSRRGGKYR